MLAAVCVLTLASWGPAVGQSPPSWCRTGDYTSLDCDLDTNERDKVRNALDNVTGGDEECQMAREALEEAYANNSIGKGKVMVHSGGSADGCHTQSHSRFDVIVDTMHFVANPPPLALEWILYHEAGHHLGMSEGGAEFVANRCVFESGQFTGSGPRVRSRDLTELDSGPAHIPNKPSVMPASWRTAVASRTQDRDTAAVLVAAARAVRARFSPAAGVIAVESFEGKMPQFVPGIARNLNANDCEAARCPGIVNGRIAIMSVVIDGSTASVRVRKISARGHGGNFDYEIVAVTLRRAGGRWIATAVEPEVVG